MQTNVNNIVCDAEETDWLDLTYTERKYVQTDKKPRKRTKTLVVALIVVAVVVAAFGTAMLIDNDFSTEVFAGIKKAYTSVLAIFQDATPTNNTITLPVNITLVDSVDGVSTFGGGKATLSFTSGTVTEVTENSVTVALDDDTTITYSNLVAVFVAVGDSVEQNTLIGKYDGTFSTVIAESGEVVKQVVASETQLSWQA
ncbi:MAG: hypothetical protein IJE50_02745 [Clostridia bacterium]|nr:hypothetical protein [Clostridia bacterium]MBQ3042113.1 hypothetical protein [Clostridia bacterium]